MGEILKKATIGNTPFWVLTVTAIFLLVTAFFLPPTAIIEESILIAVSELMGFGALWAVVKAIDKGTSAKLSHRDTTLTIGDDDTDNSNIDTPEF